VDMIDYMRIEEGDFECNRPTGTNGKPVQLFQCGRDLVSGTEIFY